MRTLGVLLPRSLIFLPLIAAAGLISAENSPSQQTSTEGGEARQGEQSSRGLVIALEGTSPLTPPITDDIREDQRQQIIQFFSKMIAATPAKREAAWQPDFSSSKAYQASVSNHRRNLREMLGLLDAKGGNPHRRILHATGNFRIEDVTIPLGEEWNVRALLFLPGAEAPTAAVIAIPPGAETREQFAGIAEGMAPSKWLTALLESNIAVAIPAMTERRGDHPISKQAAGQDRRRILWRAGFIVGRTLVGVEVQQVLALREFLASQPGIDAKRIAVMGKGQGGMTALYAGAMDEGWAAVAVVDYFQQRENCWQEPVDRVLYGQLNEFGDAEVAALIAPRPMIISTTPASEISPASVTAEVVRAKRFYGGLKSSSKLIELGKSESAIEIATRKLAELLGAVRAKEVRPLSFRITSAQIAETSNQAFESLFHYLRKFDIASYKTRTDYWQLSSTPPENRARKVEQIRKELSGLVGTIPTDPVPLRPRTSLIGETDKFLAYDVLLDVAPGVEAYGQLLIPRPVTGRVGERLPVVICQHGFDGAPKYVTGMGKGLESGDHFYHRFGQRLAERGYVVFAPYLAVPMVSRQPHFVYRADLVNPLVRQAACLGVMRTSIELTKLRSVVDFLQSLPFVQADRIGYYGLSYGGYSAIWMPPLETRLSLTVISAHFNDWQTMLTDMERFGASYWTLPDEDFYNWNILNRFDHTQLIAAMWPRPVCIEYGSDDQVTTPEWHERAWKEVAAFAVSWGMVDKIVDDKFNGPHAIHGIGTFSFLDRWLRPERAAGRDYGCRDDDYCYESVAPDLHGYIPSQPGAVPYATQLLDSDNASAIRGSFYVSSREKVLTGMAFKLARSGNPGDFIVKFGTSSGSADIGEARISSKVIYPDNDRWYGALLMKPVQLNSADTYFFEITAASGRVPDDCYTVFGPTPLDGRDYPVNFGLSFRTLTANHE